MAHLRAAHGAPLAAGRGPQRAPLLRRVALRGDAASLSGARPSPGPRAVDRGPARRRHPRRRRHRQRPHGDPPSGHACLPALGLLGGLRPRRTPARDGGHHPPGGSHRRRPRAARPGGRDHATHAHGGTDPPRQRPRAAPCRPAGAGPARPGRGLRGAHPPLPQRALSPPPGLHGRAPAADPPSARGRARARGRLSLSRAAAGGGRGAAGVARGRPHGARRLRGGPGPALAGGDLRLPRPVAGGSSAQRGPRRDAGRAGRRGRTSRPPR